MSTIEGGPGASGFVERVKALLLRPGAAFAEIDREPATIGGLYRGWVVPLALVPAVCGLIGSLVFGYGAFGITMKPSLVGAIATAVLGFLVQLAMVYLMALVVEALAPNFGGRKERIQAFKLVAYGSTAAWLAGVFQLYPPLAWLGIVGLYSLYLYFKGLPVLMKAPQEKALPYTAVVVIIAFVIALVLGAITGPIVAMTALGSPSLRASGEVAIPGAGKIDMSELEKSTRQLEEAAARIRSGEGVQPVEPDALKTYLPDQVAGYARSEVSTGSGGAAGLSGSAADGTYVKGASSLKLSVTDLGSAAPLAAMAGAFNISTSTEKNGSYEKARKIDGRMTFEKLEDGRGEYGVLVGDRFLVQASGDGVGMAELKAAVAAVDAAALEVLARS